MGGLFAKPSVVKAPAISPPVAIPDVGEDVKYIARREQQRRGRRKTFLTGDLVPTELEKKQWLG